jgi:hypothetical protein
MKIEEYIGIINSLIYKMNKFYKDDIKQDLLMFLNEIFIRIEKKEIQPNNIKNYIFICLKKKAIQLNIKYKKYSSISLNKKINEECELIDFIEDKDKSNKIEYEKIVKVARKVLTKKEYEAFFLYFVMGESQTSISKRKNISLQCLNFRIKTAIKKIKINFEC